MKNIMKIAKSLKDSGSLLKSVNQIIENEPKEQRGGVLGMLLGTLSSSLLGHMLAGKGVIRVGDILHRAGQNFNSASPFD